MNPALASSILTLPAFWYAVAIVLSVATVCLTILIIIFAFWFQAFISRQLARWAFHRRNRHFHLPSRPEPQDSPQQPPHNTMPCQDENASDYLRRIDSSQQSA